MVGEQKVKATTDAEWAEHFRLENKKLHARIKDLEEALREDRRLATENAADPWTLNLIAQNAKRALAGEVDGG